MSKPDGASALEEGAARTSESSRGKNRAQQGLPLHPDLEYPADPAMTAAGWQRRFMTDRLRLKEHLQLYEQSGFEVQIVPLKRTDLHDDCESCYLATQFFVTIYTRIKEQG